MDENQNETINQDETSNVNSTFNNDNTVNVSSYNVDGTDYTNNTTNSSQNDSGRTGFTTASLVLGILSLIPCCCWNWLGFIFGVLAVIFSVVGKEKAGEQGKKDATAGMICGIIGIVIFLIVWITTKVILAKIFGYLLSWVKDAYNNGSFENITENFDLNELIDTLKENMNSIEGM